MSLPACESGTVGLFTTPNGIREPVATAVIAFMLALSTKIFPKDEAARGGPQGWCASPHPTPPPSPAAKGWLTVGWLRLAGRTRGSCWAWASQAGPSACSVKPPARFTSLHPSSPLRPAHTCTNRPCLYAGMGNIGADVFRQASGFGMRYIAHDPYMDEASAKEIGVELVSMEELFVSPRDDAALACRPTLLWPAVACRPAPLLPTATATVTIV